MTSKTALRLAAALLVLGSLSACASKPKYSPTPEPTPSTTGTAQTEPQQQSPVTSTTGVRPGSVQDFVINVGDRVYFEVDQSTINSAASPILDAQANWLKRYPNVKIRIEGNCDERGTREYNFALGARRAQAAMEYLISRGIQPSRITTISYGKEQPIDDSATEEAWAKNRNAHTSITSGAL